MTRKQLVDCWKHAGYEGVNPNNLSDKELAQDLLNAHYEELQNNYRMFNSSEVDELLSIIRK